MPANPKYLDTNKWQRFAKISAGILGGYLLTSSIHLSIAQWVGHLKIVISTWSYSLFLIWTVFLFTPFFFKNGWKCWGIYLVSILVFAGLYLLGKQYHAVI